MPEKRDGVFPDREPQYGATGLIFRVFIGGIVSPQPCDRHEEFRANRHPASRPKFRISCPFPHDWCASNDLNEKVKLLSTGEDIGQFDSGVDSVAEGFESRVRVSIGRAISCWRARPREDSHEAETVRRG